MHGTSQHGQTDSDHLRDKKISKKVDYKKHLHDELSKTNSRADNDPSSNACEEGEEETSSSDDYDDIIDTSSTRKFVYPPIPSAKYKTKQVNTQ